MMIDSERGVGDKELDNMKQLDSCAGVQRATPHD